MMKSTCYRLRYWYREEVFTLEVILSFLVAVTGGVVCHYIIKWLDSDN